MSGLSPGTVLQLTRGRRAGQRVAVVESKPGHRVKVVTESGKTREMNTDHLFPLHRRVNAKTAKEMAEELAKLSKGTIAP